MATVLQPETPVTRVNPLASEHFIEVGSAAGLDGPAQAAITVFVPAAGRLADPPVVCFAFPGAGYSKAYYAFDMPGSDGGGQARFHRDRGWIFVACDHLGVGRSTVPAGAVLTLDRLAAANDAVVRHVMQMVRQGTLADGLQPMPDVTALGIGQSMGGCLTIVAQGQFASFHGIGILGFSGFHTVVPTRPGTPPFTWPWIARGSAPGDPRILKQGSAATPGASGEHPYQWAFHYDDEPADVVARDMEAAAGRSGSLPPWRSATTPPCARYMVAPGVVAQEAAAITVPVLIALGERDVVPDPAAEPKAFRSSGDISVFICPRMAHMHNFAHTRHLFWQRIQSWGDTVACMRRLARAEQGQAADAR